MLCPGVGCLGFRGFGATLMFLYSVVVWVVLGSAVLSLSFFIIGLSRGVGCFCIFPYISRFMCFLLLLSSFFCFFIIIIVFDFSLMFSLIL